MDASGRANCPTSRANSTSPLPPTYLGACQSAADYGKLYPRGGASVLRAKEDKAPHRGLAGKVGIVKYTFLSKWTVLVLTIVTVVLVVVGYGLIGARTIGPVTFPDVGASVAQCSFFLDCWYMRSRGSSAPGRFDSGAPVGLDHRDDHPPAHLDRPVALQPLRPEKYEVGARAVVQVSPLAGR